MQIKLVQVTNHLQFSNFIPRIKLSKLDIIWSFHFIQKLLMQNSKKPACHLSPAKCLIQQHEFLPWHNYRKRKQPNFPYIHTAGGKELGFNREFPTISVLHNCRCVSRGAFETWGRKWKDMWRKFSVITFIQPNNIWFLLCARIFWRWEPSSAATYKSKQRFHFYLTKKKQGEKTRLRGGVLTKWEY